VSIWTDIEAAIEEAEYCAETEGRAYVLLATDTVGTIEVLPEEDKGHRRVLEVIRIAPKAKWAERGGYAA